jgi:arylsulfatase I/J
MAPHVLVKNVAVTASNPDDPISGYAGIPRNMTGMGEKVRQGGYRTHYTGKLGVVHSCSDDFHDF